MSRYGLQQATDNRDPWGWDPAMEALKQLASTGETFEIYDLSEQFGVYLDSPQRYGALISSAARKGLIEQVGFAVSRRPHRDGGINRTWRGTALARGRAAA